MPRVALFLARRRVVIKLSTPRRPQLHLPIASSRIKLVEVFDLFENSCKTSKPPSTLLSTLPDPIRPLFSLLPSSSNLSPLLLIPGSAAFLRPLLLGFLMRGSSPPPFLLGFLIKEALASRGRRPRPLPGVASPSFLLLQQQLGALVLEESWRDGAQGEG